MLDKKLSSKFKKVKLLISDVDGVLTDGKIIISSDGSESKTFSVEDGTGVAIAKFSNLKVGFISGRYSKSTEIRANELGVEFCYQGYLNKYKILLEICKKLKIDLDEICYIGDGLVDIPVLEVVGCPISVPNGHRLAKEKSIYITNTAGGDGVLNEIVEQILISQNKYNETLNIMRKEKF